MKSRIALAAVLALSMLTGAGAASAGAKERAALINKGLTAKHYAAFLAAAKKAFIDESVLFLKSLADYKAQRDNAKRGMLAARMMEYYMGDGATKQINISADQLAKQMKAYAAAKKAKKFPLDLFAISEKSIRGMLEADPQQEGFFAKLPKLLK